MDDHTRRSEAVFLEYCFRWLQAGGALVLVIPGRRLTACAGALAAHFRDLSIYRLTAPDAAQYGQVVLFGVAGLQGTPRPDQASIDAFATWIETSIDGAGQGIKNPGAVAVHRLNRTEYGNAIGDLLALQIDPTALLPTDDESDGFDNMANVLKVSPSFLEQYLSAADKVSALAVGDPFASPQSKVYRPPADLSQLTHVEGLPLGTRGGFAVVHNFPLDGDDERND